jgi:hypothetical protein
VKDPFFNPFQTDSSALGIFGVEKGARRRKAGHVFVASMSPSDTPSSVPLASGALNWLLGSYSQYLLDKVRSGRKGGMEVGSPVHIEGRIIILVFLHHIAWDASQIRDSGRDTRVLSL